MVIENDLLEKLILKACLVSERYLSLISLAYKKEYFENTTVGEMFQDISEHYKNYSVLIPKEVLINEQQDRLDLYNEVVSYEFDVEKNFNFLYDDTEKYLKQQAVKQAILASVDIIESKKNIYEIYSLLEDALSKTLLVNIGLDYFGSMAERIKMFINEEIPRVPTYYPQIDEYINGGFPPCTFSVITARIHGFKSALMANISARQVLHGHNVIMLTLEMSEDMYSQRYDGIYSGLNINRIYKDKATTIEMVKALKEIRNPGKLYIKQFPTGKASAADFRVYLKELKLRKIEPHIVYCDYLNLMKPSYRNKKDMYSDVKDIAEELRALSFEFKCPFISVSQLNRIGMDDIDLAELDIVHTSESMGTIATVDAAFIIGHAEELTLYKNELHYKISKNRLGGRVGEINKFYFDANTLKIYDVSELDLWRADSLRSGDQRNIVSKKSKIPKGLGSRSRGKIEDED